MLRFPGDAMAALSFSDDVIGTLGFSGEAMAMMDFFDVGAVVVLVGAVFFTSLLLVFSLMLLSLFLLFY